MHSCVDAPATQDFSLSNSGRRVKRFRVSGLSARRIDGCRRPAWRCADRVLVALARSEAPRRPAGFPDPVSTAVCPCTVLGLSRVSGDADFRLDCSNGRRTPEELLIQFLVRSRGPDRRPSPGRTRELCSIPSSSRRPGPSAPSCSPVPPHPKIEPWQSELEAILSKNASLPKRERLTLMQIFEELRVSGCEGGTDAVRRHAAHSVKDREPALRASGGRRHNSPHRPLGTRAFASPPISRETPSRLLPNVQG